MRARGSVLPLVFFLLFALIHADPHASAGDAVGAHSSPPASPAAAGPDTESDLDVHPSEPDFNLLTLPTNLRMPKHALAMRFTHRFSRPLGEGDFSDLASDLFGFDGGAAVGLGLRFGLVPGTALSIYRTNDRVIQFAVQQDLVRPGRAPVSVSAVASLEGRDNFGEEFAPGLALVVSRRLGQRGALYMVPTWTGNTNVTAENVTSDDSTLMLGLGARLLLSDTFAIVGEYLPRLAGYKGDRGSGDKASLITFGIEKRVGGHAFQINFSNDLGTTPSQTAIGQQGPDDWFIGFNLSRRFY
jgi:hypothetical protein